MKKLSFVFAIILVASCAPSTQAPVVTNTVVPSLTPTLTLSPTSTKSPTLAPNIPTSTITPMAVVPVSANPLALNEFNAGIGMKRLNVIGTGTPHDIKFSPDGKRLAVATGRGVYLYDAATFNQNGFIDVNDSVSSIAFSPDSNFLAVGVNGKVSLWNVTSGQSLLNFDGGLVSISKLAYGLGDHVAAIGGDCDSCGTPISAMILWNAKTGKQIFSQHNIDYWTEAITFTADGKQLVYGGNGINIVESETGKLIDNYGGSPFDFIFNRDGSKLFFTSFSDSGGIIDTVTQAQEVFSLCDKYMANTKDLGACPSNNQMLIFDLSTAKQLRAVDIGIDAETLGNMFALSLDDHFLVYFNKSVMNILDLQTNKVVKMMDADFDHANVGIIEIDGAVKYVGATVNSLGQVNVFDLQDGSIIRSIKMDCCVITDFVFAPDRKTAAMIDTNTLRLWDLQSNQVIYEADLKDDFSGSIAFSPRGLNVFLATDSILEFNLQTLQKTDLGANKYDYDYADPFAVDNYHFNAKGDFIMLDYETNGDKNNPVFTDVTTGEKIVIPYNALPGSGSLEAFTISPNDKYLAFGNQDGIFVWDLQTMKLQSKLTGHEERYADGWSGKIRRVLFSPQSNLLVSVGWDGTTRLWNIFTGTELRLLNVCCSASFTPDGRYLVIAGDGVIRVWGIPR